MPSLPDPHKYTDRQKRKREKEREKKTELERERVRQMLMYIPVKCHKSHTRDISGFVLENVRMKKL